MQRDFKLSEATRKAVEQNVQSVKREYNIMQANPTLKRQREMRIRAHARRVQGECPHMQGELF